MIPKWLYFLAEVYSAGDVGLTFYQLRSLASDFRTGTNPGWVIAWLRQRGYIEKRKKRGDLSYYRIRQSGRNIIEKFSERKIDLSRKNVAPTAYELIKCRRRR